MVQTFFKVIFSRLIIRIIENRTFSEKGILLCLNIEDDTLSYISTVRNETACGFKDK